MALPPGFQLEQPPAIKLPPGFQLEASPVSPTGYESVIPRTNSPQPDFLTRLGQGTASLADNTLGGILPAVAQQLVYPFARVGNTPREAQVITRRTVEQVEQPFGKLFGVTNTPGYQQEGSRQLLNALGEGFQKGAKWIAGKTGAPASDVENMLGTMTFTAPAVVRTTPTAIGAVKQAVAPVIDRTVAGLKMPFEKSLQAAREKASLADYVKGPQLDAIAEAKRLGIALNPVDVQPTIGPKFTSMVAGEKGLESIANANKGNVRAVVLKELDLPPTMQLDKGAAFDAARAKLAAPYDEIGKLPSIVADDTARAALEQLRPSEHLIGSDRYAGSINAIIDSALDKTSSGLTGAQLLENISTLRKRARKTYNSKTADLAALDVADTNLAVASALEGMIESSVTNPKLLGQFKDARKKMARAYAYEGATDFNTGFVDVSKLARITAKDNAMTGDIASLGKIAGNFPEAFTTQAGTPWAKAASLGRTGAAGSMGGLLGYAIGGDYAGAAIGSVTGALTGKFAERTAANRLASPGYQAGLKLKDARIPVNQLGASMQPIPQSQAIVPYQAPVEVLSAGEGPYRPNFVRGRAGNAEVKATGVDMEGPPRLPAPSAESTLAGVAGRRSFDYRMEKSLAEQANAVEGSKLRGATGRGTLFDLDPITGRLKEASAGVKGATPEVWQSNTGASLDSASSKLASGQPFAMSAAEKAAWNNTRADLAAVEPGFSKLSDRAVAGKIMDREWVASAITKAQEKAQAFDAISKSAESAQKIREAVKSRDQLMDLVESLQDKLRAPRAVPGTSQGPKTRAAIRNKLSPTRIELNNLIIPD